MTILTGVRAAFRAAQAKFGAWRRSVFDRRVLVRFVDERPSTLRRRRLYVTRSRGEPVFGYMVCPCGCRHTLHLRFLPDRRPRWTLQVSRDDAVTIWPSVWRREGCRSHFFVTDGHLVWCD